MPVLSAEPSLGKLCTSWHSTSKFLNQLISKDSVLFTQPQISSPIPNVSEAMFPPQTSVQLRHALFCISLDCYPEQLSCLRTPFFPF